MAKTQTRRMSDEHKAALEEGRQQGRIVRRYLEALEAQKPRRGRKVDVAALQAKLDALQEELDSGSLSGLDLLAAAQQRIDLEGAIAQASTNGAGDIAELEDSFVQVAKTYAQRKGLTYEAFRTAGVSPGVLRSAGIPR